MAIPVTLIILLTFAGCGPSSDRERSGRADSPANTAGGFDITDHGSYRVINVYDPWQGARGEVFTYILADRNEELPAGIPAGTVIRTPVASVICMSTTHVAMLDKLGKTEAISAVSGTRLVFSPHLRKRIENGEVPDIGYDTNLDYEKIVEINPDVVLAYGVDAGSSAWLDRLPGLGITVVMIGEYLEATPLAQAGWLKIVAHLFDRQELAGNILADIEEQYLKLARLAADAGSRPVVMTGLPWRNSWFVSGGRSHFASLATDAGGRYLWEGNTGRQNFPVDIESVLSRGQEADFWINTGTATSAADIVAGDPRLGMLPPFIKGNIYNNNARVNRYGGNDYWESGIVNPHIILGDLISIMHPGLIPDHELVYYRKLE